MREILSLLRANRRARLFFAALTQSSLGTGAAFVALVLLAYDRFSSPWAIGLILLADVVPAMACGPIFGAAADRWSRRRCAVMADLLRAVAFGGIVLVHGFVPTVALALLAGVGTGLFTPASLAALPSLVETRRLPAATSLYGAITDLGFVAGPVLAATVLVVTDAPAILVANAVTFLISAFVLTELDFGAAAEPSSEIAERPSLLADARSGIHAIRATRGLAVILVASAVALFFGGVFNVAELLLAKNLLGGGGSGYSVLVAVYGLGFIAGSLSGAKGGEVARLRRWYLSGLFLMALGFGASGAVPSIGLAGVTFVIAGVGNGMLLVYERLLIQKLVPDGLAGRVFGSKDALTAWAFALAFVSGPILLQLLGTRPVLLGAGAGGLIAWALAVGVLTRARVTERVSAPSPQRVAVNAGP